MDFVMADPVVDDYLRRLDDAARILPDERRRELVEEISAHIAESRAGDAGEAEVRTLLDRLGEPEEIVAAARDEETLDQPLGPAAGAPTPPPPSSVHGRSGYGDRPPGAPTYAAVPPMAPELRSPGIGLEISAVLLMTVGSVVPVLLWLVGVVLLWSSRRWRPWEKIVATLVVPGGPLALVYLAVFLPTRVETCSTGGEAAGTATGPDAVAQATQTHCTSSGFALPAGLGVSLAILWVVAPVVIAVLLITRARARAATEPPVEVWRGPGTSNWGPLEIAAVALLAAGAFVLPIIGPIAGLVCVWISTAWTTTEKWIATALTLVPVAVGAVLVLAVIAV